MSTLVTSYPSAAVLSRKRKRQLKLWEQDALRDDEYVEMLEQKAKKRAQPQVRSKDGFLVRRPPTAKPATISHTPWLPPSCVTGGHHAPRTQRKPQGVQSPRAPRIQRAAEGKPGSKQFHEGQTTRVSPLFKQSEP